MGSADLQMGILFLVQTTVGILGNTSLLCLYSLSLFTGHTFRPTDLILNQLVLANILGLLSRGIPQIMVNMGLKYFLNDMGCKLVIYFHRVTRGVSLTTTCLLSGFQAMKLCSRASLWTKHKMRCPRYIGFCCFLCWVPQFWVNALILMRVIGPRHSKNTSAEKSYDYCFSVRSERSVVFLHAAAFFSFDFLCLGLMGWASGSMVLVLLRHQQRVQHIHTNRFSPRNSPEARATRTILVLVGFFVCFYCLSSVSTLYITLTESPRQNLVEISVYLASCFPAFSPFLLIASDIRISQFFSDAC